MKPKIKSKKNSAKNLILVTMLSVVGTFSIVSSSISLPSYAAPVSESASNNSSNNNNENNKKNDNSQMEEVPTSENVQPSNSNEKNSSKYSKSDSAKKKVATKPKKPKSFCEHEFEEIAKSMGITKSEIDAIRKINIKILERHRQRQLAEEEERQRQFKVKYLNSSGQRLDSEENRNFFSLNPDLDPSLMMAFGPESSNMLDQQELDNSEDFFPIVNYDVVLGSFSKK